MVARLLWQHSTFTHHCHEPFEAFYWGNQGDECVETSLSNPLEISTGTRASIASIKDRSGLLIKEMSFQINEEQLLLLESIATVPILFVMSDPRLSTTSRLRIVKELSNAETFPAFESGWASLYTHIQTCRTMSLPYLLLDSRDLRAQPATVTNMLIERLNLKAETDLYSWSPRSSLQLCTPDVGSLMGEGRTSDDPFYRRVLSSSGILPQDEIDWEANQASIEAADLAQSVSKWMEFYADLLNDPARIRCVEELA